MATTNLKELVAFGLACGELLKSVSDGFQFDDIGKFVNAARLAGPAFKDAGQALSEYTGMTEQEAVDLENFVKEQFDIDDDAVETAIEAALTAVIKLHDVIGLFVNKPVPVPA